MAFLTRKTLQLFSFIPLLADSHDRPLLLPPQLISASRVLSLRGYILRLLSTYSCEHWREAYFRRCLLSGRQSSVPGHQPEISSTCLVPCLYLSQLLWANSKHTYDRTLSSLDLARVFTCFASDLALGLCLAAKTVHLHQLNQSCECVWLGLLQNRLSMSTFC